jgi:ribosome-associated heat shock protein Hsp15
MNHENPSSSSPTLRLDKWLWFARMAKTRSLAAQLCAAGCVTIGGRDGIKPHHPVRVGDCVTVDLPRERRQLVVRALGVRRGPPAEARLLYDEPVPPVQHEKAVSEWVSVFAEEAFAEG